MDSHSHIHVPSLRPCGRACSRHPAAPTGLLLTASALCHAGSAHHPWNRHRPPWDGSVGFSGQPWRAGLPGVPRGSPHKLWPLRAPGVLLPGWAQPLPCCSSEPFLRLSQPILQGHGHAAITTATPQGDLKMPVPTPSPALRERPNRAQLPGRGPRHARDISW